jgi:hypothetical protein
MFRNAPATQVDGARETQASKTQWTAADIPDQTDRVAIITGANTGVGFETASALASRGAQVVPRYAISIKAKQQQPRLLRPPLAPQ